MAECGERVGRGTITYPCQLPRDHRGPCVAPESQASVNNRRAWEEAGSPSDWHNSMRADKAEVEIQASRESREAREALANFQGEPRTFAHPEVSERGTSRPHPAVEREVRDMAARATTEAPVATQEAPGPCGCDHPDSEHTDGPTSDGRTYCRACTGCVGRHLEPAPVEPAPLPGGSHITHRQRAESVEREMGADLAHSFKAKDRPGDQRMPEVNERASIQSMVIADIEERTRVGIERYGTPLQAFNKRNAIQDAYEEALDLTMYLRQMMVERVEAIELVSDLNSIVNDPGVEIDPHHRLTISRLIIRLFKALGTADRGR